MSVSPNIPPEFSLSNLILHGKEQGARGLGLSWFIPFFPSCYPGDASEAVPYLVERQKLFGLVKTRRKRHREIDACTQQIWALTS